MQDYPGQNIKILMADLNAKISREKKGYEEIIGQHDINEINHNGERFVDSCAIGGLVIGESIFQHKRIHKAT
jgi:hypothetical protein